MKDAPQLTPIQLSDNTWLVPCLIKPKDNAYLPLVKPNTTAIDWAQVQKRHSWGPEEDTALSELVADRGAKAWSAIAEALNSRVHQGIPIRHGKQCRQRYYNHIDSALVKGRWTAEEDLYIIQTQRVVGNKWSHIAKRLVGRTENQVKNRFKSLIKRGRTENTADICVPKPTRLSTTKNSAFVPYKNPSDFMQHS